ncbi:15-hydroxyprostaglandin dehydrogenase [NAD(+)]-like isoform X2 [Photinus pyralis]|uniref:15-hydroxyprostaglandin dehydrogenase [NAD(+)]-like isoform X2 n=1 Tax=Photinus pyralis TaxID=7054 RepID=UPI001267760A|nr:15-hydroxyprostaglandin dehydrogenase [NAD(+)]-like isoform X2 [Photinus pyralis]XP_031357228.1 15-hydroxyprostaglandin dehydrogenase [NAD(+)]-like isoform X2 [Photinus pyralis]
MSTRHFFTSWILLAFPIYVTKTYELNGTTALVTGGSRGIGFEIARHLLSNGVRGVTLVSLNVEKGRGAAKLLNREFGYGRAIFIPADVSDEDQLENAFEISALHWRGLDIVVNNAGVINENDWKSLIGINIAGTLQGTLLGFKYLGKNGGGRGGVIINVSSILALPSTSIGPPIYSASKLFINSLGRSLGHSVYYDYNRVRIITICPGYTTTDMNDLSAIRDAISQAWHPDLVELLDKYQPHYQTQASDVSESVMEILKTGSSGSTWVIEGGECYEVEYPDRKTMRTGRG